MALRIRPVLGWLAIVVTLLACGDDDGTTSEPDASAPRDASTQVDASRPLEPDASIALDGAVPGDDDGGGIVPGPTLPPFCDALPPADRSGTWESSRVSYDDEGMLQYASDAQGNRVPDFGYAGYHYGGVALPELPEVERVGPGDGDDTARIQAAIDEVADRPLAERGAVVLEAGTYEIAGTLRIEESGIVLRGAGDGSDAGSNTILRATGDNPHQRTVIVVGSNASSAWSRLRSGTTIDVTTQRVLVGARTIEVEDASGFSVGDPVVLRRPSTSAWIGALGGGGGSSAWTPGEIDLVHQRYVRAIDGRNVTLDVPVFDTLDRAHGVSTLSVVEGPDVAREVGVESLRIDIQTAGGEDENHAWSAIGIVGAEDAWVRDVTALHFGFAGVRVTAATRVTVRDVRAIEPVAIVTGSRMYNFAVERGAQQVLFEDVEAQGGRHNFVSNGIAEVSGVVFLRGRSSGARASSEGHRRWSQGLLFDSIVETSPATQIIVGLYNRGDYGTLHGWSSVNSVLWRYDVGGRRAVVQRPPLGQNYAIGTIGTVTGDGPFDGPAGFFETGEGTLLPGSLYEAQLCDRLRREAR
ncbi:glycoside hydrolase family 55 protein [Sandaracinus amylolyticus]|uniref:glycoside hydrolase family 55 protein n=1 Tax=Sandaracinus amylolyticus TaxID=927083 RepID=UPI001F2A464D|nr:glycoside hydrolase family 55 protein [Sandaracinus amylolyticus]UJR84784.1 Hypothetical protein I5071_68630 [Sandaracinus amylolyticus]